MRISVLSVLACIILLVTALHTDAHAASSTSSSVGQVALLLQQATVRNGLPAGLLKAIAWQESSWRQEARGADGEVGVMQILPKTAWGLNTQARTHYNLYSLSGNIALGAMYVRTLWRSFKGNLVKTISAYNRGPWSVTRYGIRNWGYVNRVLALMRSF